MEIIDYPLLTFQIKPDAVLGILVGTGLNAVEKDVETVKLQLGKHLSKEYKKHGNYPYFEMEQPRLKILKVTVRPAYQSDDATFPLAQAYKVPMPIVYGPVPGGFECYLPLLKRRFSYFRKDQLTTLAQHFSTHLLGQLEPEKIYRMLSYVAPKLEKVSLKINLNREPDWGSFNYNRSYEVLPKLAEQYPNPQNTRKREKPISGYGLGARTGSS
jgi:ATP-dependent Clp protease ATP-binding subunit ClpC